MERRRFLAGSMAASMLSLPSIGMSQEARTLRFVPYADVASIDPIWSSAYAVRTHALLVWDTLYGVDIAMQPHPQMAEGHEVSADGRRWTIRLREGLTFHDGTQVLARDCVASLRRWFVRDVFGQAVADATDDLAAIDDRSLVFRLKRPFPLLLSALAKPSSYVPVMMPERLAETDPFRQVPEAIGSGPFTYAAAERVPGARHVYVKYAGYRPREGVPSFTAGPRLAHLDRIEFRVIADPATAIAALQSGSVDWVEQPLIDLLGLLRRSRGIRVEIKDRSGMCAQVRLNHTQPPFTNPAVRRTLLKALDQSACMMAVAGAERDLWRDGVGFFSSTSPMANDAAMDRIATSRDYAALRRELRDAGYNGERVVLLAGEDVPRIAAVAAVVAETMRRIGINLDYTALDWGTVLARIPRRAPLAEGGWSCFVTYWSGIDLADPAVSAPLRGSGPRAGAGWPDSPALESLREAWFAAAELPERQRIARELQQQAAMDVPFIPAGEYLQPTAYRGNLQGMLDGLPQFTHLRKEV